MTLVKMQHYLLRPGAPLVFGTGRPLDFGLGGESLAYPFPSTVAGAIRAAAAVAEGKPPDPYFECGSIALGHSALVQLDPNLAPRELLFARPADAVFIGGRLLALKPYDTPPDCWTDLPVGLRALELSEPVDAKPDSAEPWWTRTKMQAWLASTANTAAEKFKDERGPRPAERTHVVIEANAAGGAEQGGLFRTSGEDFGPGGAGGGHAIWLETGCAGLDGLGRRLGGEGRLVRIELLQQALSLPTSPEMNDSDKRRVRFVLMTPALFERGGWFPDWMCGSVEAGLPQDRATRLESATVPGTNVKVRLVAAAIGRAQSYSGWQKNEQGAGPGQPWRVVPAGSVYWFDVLAGDAAAMHGRSLCEGRWLNDGWGYGVIGKGS